MHQHQSSESYPLISDEKLRYADTDRLGHINNTVFAMLFETGYVELLYGDRAPKIDEQSLFRPTQLTIEFLGETAWPGAVKIGTRVREIRDSSVDLEQAMFQEHRCVATAKCTATLFNVATGQPCSLPPIVQHYLEQSLGST
ncbi:Thioesterase superfamily protein (fragment) [Bradyrhizobium sp. ORS 375]